jgi:hypothetical protein
VVQPATRDGRLSCAVAFVKKRPRNIETGNRLLGLLPTPPAVVRRVGFFPTEVKVSWGSANRV